MKLNAVYANLLREFLKRLNYFFVALSLFLIRLYQVFLAPFSGGNCRFYPSCSHYALEAYQQHSWWRATSLVFNRLLRCRPGGPQGYDPVPGRTANCRCNSETKKMTARC